MTHPAQRPAEWERQNAVKNPIASRDVRREFQKSSVVDFKNLVAIDEYPAPDGSGDDRGRYVGAGHLRSSQKTQCDANVRNRTHKNLSIH